MTLRVQGLGAALKGKPILQDLDLEVGEGWFGILGVNGSGKTTLLRALNARLPITAGQIVWRNTDLTAQDAIRAKSFGFAPPFDTFPITVTAGDLIALTASLRGCDRTEPANLYEALGVASLLDKPFSAMSSGMKQRVSVFFAFMGPPELVLLDEPFNWLDPIAVYDLKREIRRYADSGKVVITALHEVETFIRHCDAGLLLHDGRIVQRFDAARMAEGRADPARLEADIYERLKA